MNILVCIKRVPATGAKIVLTEDGQAIDTRHLGFTISPHEECAVEEAIRLVEAHGGRATVLTLGPEAAIEQLRESLAMGVSEAILLETDGDEWDPVATARAITDAIRARQSDGEPFDLLLFGNESADAGGYQVGIRVARALGLPCVTGVKKLDVDGDTLTARREIPGGWGVYRLPLPAVVTVKEGINLPRYPSLPGKLRAKKKPIERITPQKNPGGPRMVRLKTPPETGRGAQILGEGPAAASRVVELLRELGVLQS
ncbi:MAG: electron transfer flavoprotein subunit beta/FixA family protein [Anaerolineae bacterium]